MSKVRVVLNSKGVREMLQSKEARDICEEHAKQIESRLGDGYSIDSQKGKYRQIVQITAESNKAINDCIHHNALLKAMR